MKMKSLTLDYMAVSQFTLYGVLKGNKPDFHVAMPPDKAKLFYDSLVERFKKSYDPDAIKGTFSVCFYASLGKYELTKFISMMFISLFFRIKDLISLT